MGFRRSISDLLALKLGVSLVLGISFFCAVPDSVLALPFNQDMVGNQLVTGTIMRPKPPGSVPIGSVSRRVESYNDALELKNPQTGDERSATEGKRLFEMNCQVCHGRWEDGKHIGNTLVVMPAMDLTLQMYKDKSDGSIFGAVYFGKGLMPAYGWKFSPTEHWDLVNYVRRAQAGNP